MNTNQNTSCDKSFPSNREFTGTLKLADAQCRVMQQMNPRRRLRLKTGTVEWVRMIAFGNLVAKVQEAFPKLNGESCDRSYRHSRSLRGGTGQNTSKNDAKRCRKYFTLGRNMLWLSIFV